MAQNCPFLLLLAPFFPIKESIGPYQNSCSTVPKPHPISRATRTQPWFQLTANTSCFLGTKPARAQVLTLPRHSRVAGESSRVLVLLQDLLLVNPLVAHDGGVWCRNVTAQDQLAITLSDLSSNFWTCIREELDSS